MGINMKTGNVQVRLGSTDIVVNKNGFGALPIQRISNEDAVFLLRKAYQNGINFLIRQGLIPTVSISWELHLKISGKSYILLLRQQHRLVRRWKKI